MILTIVDEQTTSSFFSDIVSKIGQYVSSVTQFFGNLLSYFNFIFNFINELPNIIKIPLIVAFSFIILIVIAKLFLLLWKVITGGVK